MNFALILFVLVVLTGIAWLADKLIFLPGRRRKAQAAVEEFDRQQEKMGERFADENPQASRSRLRDNALRQPWWLEYSASFFPVIVLVFVLRSFVVEPFKIPSGSMLPTLFVGDFILVNKFEYGIRLPILDKKIIPISNPHRGDVVVFRFPKDESVDFIKRVVGVPGDTIAYQNKELTINGQPISKVPDGEFLDDERDPPSFNKRFTEVLGPKTHEILNNIQVPPFVMGASDYPYRENCKYNAVGVICTVPPGHYFMMGDNRDNSEDSRYWGFVPDKNIVGRAFFIWLNFANFKRIGGFE